VLPIGYYLPIAYCLLPIAYLSGASPCTPCLRKGGGGGCAEDGARLYFVLGSRPGRPRESPASPTHYSLRPAAAFPPNFDYRLSQTGVDQPQRRSKLQKPKARRRCYRHGWWGWLQGEYRTCKRLLGCWDVGAVQKRECWRPTSNQPAAPLVDSPAAMATPPADPITAAAVLRRMPPGVLFGLVHSATRTRRRGACVRSTIPCPS
jgi:hypothetical protein